VRVQRSEQLKENEAGESHREWVALREAFFLGKVVECAIGAGEVTVIGRGIHEVEVRED
jgi:hypothetical protein